MKLIIILICSITLLLEFVNFFKVLKCNYYCNMWKENLKANNTIENLNYEIPVTKLFNKAGINEVAEDRRIIINPFRLISALLDSEDTHIYKRLYRCFIRTRAFFLHKMKTPFYWLFVPAEKLQGKGVNKGVSYILNFLFDTILAWLLNIILNWIILYFNLNMTF